MLESKRRAMIFFGLSLLLAIIAGFLFLQKVRALNADLGGMTEVYVANADIPSRAVIQPDQVTTMEIPNRFVVKKSHVLSADELKNKVSVVPLSKGDIITKNMLKPVSNVANENNRLVSLFASEKIHFDQELESLDRVDIIVSQKIEDKPQTTIYMRDVPVAMVAREDGKFKGVALEVPLESAPKLIHMQNYADSIRVLKANVGKEEQQPSPLNEQQPATPQEEEAAKAKQQEEAKKAEQAKKKEEAKKKDADKK